MKRRSQLSLVVMMERYGYRGIGFGRLCSPTWAYGTMRMKSSIRPTGNLRRKAREDWRPMFRHALYNLQDYMGKRLPTAFWTWQPHVRMLTIEWLYRKQDLRAL